MRQQIRSIFNRHFEWAALAAGLVLIGLMNPYVDNGISWCLFEMAGLSFCPGEGLGHSIAFTFRGDLSNAMQANLMGPLAIIFLIGRILALLNKKVFKHKFNNNYITDYGKND